MKIKINFKLEKIKIAEKHQNFGHLLASKLNKKSQLLNSDLSTIFKLDQENIINEVDIIKPRTRKKKIRLAHSFHIYYSNKQTEKESEGDSISKTPFSPKIIR